MTLNLHAGAGAAGVGRRTREGDAQRRLALLTTHVMPLMATTAASRNTDTTTIVGAMSLPGSG